LVDCIYPVEPDSDSGIEIAARVGSDIVCVHRPVGKAGSITFLGFRPRDDQSASLGYESRSWFDVLRSLGAYPNSRSDSTAHDNPSIVSRESPYLATRFPNGAIAVAAHYRSHPETWGGGIHRDPAEDEKLLKQNPLPSDRLELQDFRVAGHK